MIRFFAAVAFATIAFSTYADEAVTKEARALNLISKMATDICGDAQITGSSHQAELKGQVDAKLNVLIKKLGDAKVGVAADYSEEAHIGVLRHQVLDAIKETTSCKRHVLDVLLDRLFQGSQARNGSTTDNAKTFGSSPAEAYLIATHPTKVSVKDMSFIRLFVDNGKNYLSASLENKSEIPALNVVTDIIKERNDVPFSKSKIIPVTKSNYYKSSETGKITVPANSVGFFPIVSVDEIFALLGPGSQNFCLYDTSLEPIDPFEKSNAFNQAYDSIPTQVRDYHAQTKQLGLRLKVKYETVFKETITNYVLVFAHLAEKDSEGWIWYPTTKKIAPINCIGT